MLANELGMRLGLRASDAQIHLHALLAALPHPIAGLLTRVLEPSHIGTKICHDHGCQTRCRTLANLDHCDIS